MVDHAFFLGAVFLFRFIIIKKTRWRRPKSDLWWFSLKVFLVLVGVILFSDKVAVKEMEKAASQGIQNTFIIYYIISYPFTELGVSARYCIVAINLLLSYLLAIYLYDFSRNDGSRSKSSLYYYLLIMFYPDIVYFSFFSLRDVGLATFMAFFMIGLSRSNLKLMAVSALAILLTRPELIVWLTFLYVFFLISYFKKERDRWAIYVFLAVFLYFSLTQLFFWFLDFNHWGASGVTIADSLNFLLERRYERQFSDSDGSGGESPTLPTSLFYQLSLYSRIFLQSLSFAYLSLYPDSQLLLIAIATGIYPMYLLLRIGFRSFQSKWLLIVCVVSSYLIYGPFMVNGGNAFRLRTSMIVLIFTLVTLTAKKTR